MEIHTNIFLYFIECVITNAHLYIAIFLAYKIARDWLNIKKISNDKLDKIIENQRFTHDMIDYTNKHLPK